MQLDIYYNPDRVFYGNERKENKDLTKTPVTDHSPNLSPNGRILWWYIIMLPTKSS